MVCLVFVGRIAVLGVQMRPAVSDRVTWSVCRSVCHSIEPCKNGSTDRDAVWVENSSGHKKLRIRVGSRYPMGRGNFEGKRVAHCKV